MFNFFQDQPEDFLFFLFKPLRLRWSLFIKLNEIFDSVENFNATYSCYLIIIPSSSLFEPSGKFQRSKIFTSDMLSDSKIKVIPGILLLAKIDGIWKVQGSSNVLIPRSRLFYIFGFHPY